MSGAIRPVVTDIHLPAGVAGPDPVDFDVRCFLVPHAVGLVLVDTGVAGNAERIAAILATIGAGWGEITDVVLTHRHPDHIGGLDEVVALAPRSRVWAGAADQEAIPYDGRFGTLAEGGMVRDLRVLETPGHTPGHCCLVRDEDSVLFTGDLVGASAGTPSRGPAAFTADAGLAEQSLRRVMAARYDRMLFSHGDEIPRPSDALLTFMRGAT